MRIGLRTTLFAASLLVLAVQSHAGQTFDFSSGVAASASGTPVLPGGPTALVGIPAAGSLSFSTQDGESIDASLTGGAAINIGEFSYIADGAGLAEGFSVSFAYRLTLTEKDSGESGFVDIAGTISGNASTTGDASAISTTLSDLVFTSNPMLILGGQEFYVSISSVVGPGTLSPGLLQVLVSISPAAVPEPGSMLMLGLGGGAVGLFGLRRRRRAG